MANKKFPNSACSVCQKDIFNPSEGGVYADDYLLFLRARIEEECSPERVISGKDGNFVNAVTASYFLQFEEKFRRNN